MSRFDGVASKALNTEWKVGEGIVAKREAAKVSGLAPYFTGQVDDLIKAGKEGQAITALIEASRSYDRTKRLLTSEARDLVRWRAFDLKRDGRTVFGENPVRPKPGEGADFPGRSGA